MFHAMLVLVITLGTLILDACGPPATATVHLSEQDAGRTVQLRPGQRMEITLAGNPTTGYQWEPTIADSAILHAVGEPVFKPDTSALGSGGQVTTIFEAVAVGQTMVTLAYHRPFEAGMPPLKTFAVTVMVQ
jgi:inhibitor of cysteine peptidase